MARRARAFVGISGYDYKGWGGTFYPEDVPRQGWFRYASRLFTSIELNGTFYSLKTPSAYRRWHDESPHDGFLLAVKGSRFITHNLKLRQAEGALANFFASGVLALGRKTGPLLWQLPASYAFDPERVRAFLRLLPRTSAGVEALARGHDHRVPTPLLTAPEPFALRHALEPRHPSYFHPELFALLREERCGFVISDSAGKFGTADEVTAGFAYVRLHGSRQLYASDYADGELDDWAGRIRSWAGARKDVFVYFDNDARGHAPHDALRLQARVADLALPRANQQVVRRAEAWHRQARAAEK